MRRRPSTLGPPAGRASPLRLSGAALLLALAPSCGSSSVEGSEIEGVRAQPAAARRSPSGPAIVEGTTVDAATGEPLAGVLVTGPGDLRTRSDERGRFRLRGLPQGTEGELQAVTDTGLEGVVRLRPLSGGRPLEVVIHLRRPPA